MQGVERPYTLPVFSGKGSVTLAITPLNFGTSPAAPNDPMIVANKQICAESCRKRAKYKKQKAGQKNVQSVIGKSSFSKKAGGFLGKMF